MRRQYYRVPGLYRDDYLENCGEVGFVEGIIAATTPRGEAISTILSLSVITPTVFRSSKVIPNVFGGKSVLFALVVGLPKPVSS